MSNFKNSEHGPLIKSSRSFDGLSDANKKYLFDHSSHHNYKKGASLWLKSDPGEFCAFIVDGLIEISNPNLSGDDHIFGIFGPGDIIGLSAILKRSPYPASAIVGSKHCSVIKLFIRSIEHDLAESDRANMHAWQRERLLSHEQILREKIMILSAGSLHTRLIEFFEHLRLRFSKNQIERAQSIHIPLSLTKTQIAKVIEARVETVIRILNRWEKAGYIKFDSGSISISKIEKLKNLKEV